MLYRCKYRRIGLYMDYKKAFDYNHVKKLCLFWKQMNEWVRYNNHSSSLAELKSQCQNRKRFLYNVVFVKSMSYLPCCSIRIHKHFSTWQWMINILSGSNDRLGSTINRSKTKVKTSKNKKKVNILLNNTPI